MALQGVLRINMMRIYVTESDSLDKDVVEIDRGLIRISLAKEKKVDHLRFWRRFEEKGLL